MRVCACVQRKRPMFDFEYFVFERRMQIRANEASSASISILSRVKFEELKALGDQLGLLAREKQVRTTPQKPSF